MTKPNFQIEFKHDKLPSCMETGCRENSFLYMKNAYGGARYICPDCAYDLGYINGHGFPTMQGENAYIRDLEVTE